MTDEAEMLRLAELPDGAPTVKTSLRISDHPVDTEDKTSRQHFLIEVRVKGGAQLSLEYAYHGHSGAARNRVLHSLAYIHYALQTELKQVGAPSVPLPDGVAVVDAGDLAVLPGAVGYERKKGDDLVHLIPDVHFFSARGYEPLRRHVGTAWNQRLPQFLWRGSTTGAGSLDRVSITDLPRYRLCLATSAFPDVVDAGFTSLVQSRSCEEADALREHLIALNLWRERMGWEGFCQYRYIIDIDGNAGSWGLFEKLLTGSCVVKVSSPYEQWYHSDLEPWTHYVPVANDLSDLEEIVHWCRSNDGKCRQIGEAGRAVALTRSFDGQMSLAAEKIFQAAQHAECRTLV